ALQYIPHVQLAPDLLQIDMSSLVGEGGVAPDHERTGYARQVCSQTFGHAINEIILFWITAQIGKGQNDDRKARRRWLMWLWRGCFRLCRDTHLQRINPHRLCGGAEVGSAGDALRRSEARPH